MPGGGPPIPGGGIPMPGGGGILIPGGGMPPIPGGGIPLMGIPIPGGGGIIPMGGLIIIPPGGAPTPLPGPANPAGACWLPGARLTALPIDYTLPGPALAAPSATLLVA